MGGQQRAGLILEPPARVRINFPFRQHDRRVGDGRADGDFFRIGGLRGQFQIQFQHPVRVRALRQRNQTGLAVGDWNGGNTVDGGGPQHGPGGDGQAKVGIAAILDEVACVGQGLSFLGNAGLERSAVHDLTDRIALGQRLQGEAQIERARGIAIGGENRRVKEQAIVGRHFSRLQRQEVGGNFRRLDLELIGADDQRVTLLGLGVERARAGEQERFALALEGAVVSGEQRVRAGHGRVQLHDITAVGLLPVANVLSRELHVVVFI